MNELRKAAERALDALDSDNPDIQLRSAIALRQALAEPANSTTNLVEPKASSQTEQEPVAWMKEWEDGHRNLWLHKPSMFYENELQPLYTAPPKRKWVGLTDQEIENLWNQHESRFDYYSFSCDIEAKLRERNA